MRNPCLSCDYHLSLVNRTSRLSPFVLAKDCDRCNNCKPRYAYLDAITSSYIEWAKPSGRCSMTTPAALHIGVSTEVL